jgi:class 3 adenylate cyclase/DNA-binding NarL/FixJ family response regulator
LGLNKIVSKPVILCVDDERIVLSSLQTELIDALGDEYLIETAEGGEEALKLIEEWLADRYEIPLVISDYMMPNMKGDELLKRIHALSPKTRKVMLTGQADIDAVGNAINYANLYHYIPKPWHYRYLILTVSKAIESYFKDKQLEEKNRELERKVKTFYKFVPIQFLKLLNLQEYDDIELGSYAERTMSVMFADIRSFTAFSEKLTSQDTFRFINGYLSNMVPVIQKHGGFIDKYIGDAIMALFEEADEAVQTAIEMLSCLSSYNEGRKRAGYIPIAIGIGINTGQLMLGTVGENHRMQTTVIGDMVNLAARVEDLTKIYETPILITEHTWRQLKNPGGYAIRMIDTVRVRGKTEPATIFEVLDTIEATLFDKKVAKASIFEQALMLYRLDEFKEAEAQFEQCLAQCPEDKATQIYLQRIRSR